MSQVLRLDAVTLGRKKVPIFLIWLFHISGIIGISVGYVEWFVPKTPINLGLIFFILLWSIKLKDLKFWSALVIFFSGGMIVEWIGVHFGFPFGIYSYGENLGVKVLEVPLFIGINWAVLTLICGAIATNLMKSKWSRVVVGATLMLLLDFFLEHTAPIFDFWSFEGGLAPPANYIAWFGISAVFHFIYQSLSIKVDDKLSYHIYIAQLLFFIWFYGFYHL